MRSIIINLKKFVKKNSLQLFVFKYDKINAQITIMIVILNKKNEIIKISFKYHDFVDVFDETNANKLFEHRSYNHAIETKNKMFFFRFYL